MAAVRRRSVSRPAIASAGRGATQERIETPVPPVDGEGPAAPAAPADRPPKPVGPVTLKQIRDAWPEVLASLQRTKRTAWMAALSAQVLEYRTDDDVLVLGFASPSDVQGLRSGTGNQNSAELLRAAIHEVLGVTVKFLPRVVGANATPNPGANEAAVPPQGSAPVGRRIGATGATRRSGRSEGRPLRRPLPRAQARGPERARRSDRACRAGRLLGDGRDPERSRSRGRGRSRDRVATASRDHGRRA